MNSSAHAASHAFAKNLKSFKTASGKSGKFYSLPALAKQFPNITRLPISLRIVLESVLRNCDGKRVTAQHIAELARYEQEPLYLDSKDYASALREAYAAEKRNVERLGQAKAP